MMRALARRRSSIAAQRHQLERGDDRRQRVAQLVAEHRQELVLGAIGDLGLAQRVARFAEETVVVERERGALRELADESAVFGAEAPPRLGLQRAHRTDRSAARDQRDDARRADAEAGDEGAEVRIGKLVGIARLEVGEERLAGRDRPRERSRRVARRDVAADEVEHLALARRVDVVGELPLQLAVAVEQVDPADVGDARNDHRADRGQRRFLLERAREQRAGADELLQARVRALGRRARLALGIEEQLALGLVLRAERRGSDERIGDRLDLDQAGLDRLDRRALAERQRGAAQATDRRGDRAGEEPRGDAADAEREQDAAAVGERRVAHGGVLDGGGHAERHHPARRAHARQRRVHLDALDGRGAADGFVAVAELGEHRLQRRRRRRSHVARVLARAGDAKVGGVEDGDDPVVGDALLADDLQDRLGPDDRREHVAELAVTLDRNAHRDAEVALRPARERADDRRACSHHLGDALRVGHLRRRCAERRRGVEERDAGRRRQQDGPPLRPRREDAPRRLVGVGEVDVDRRAERVGERQRLQRRDGQSDLGVDGGRERARQVARRLLGLRALLLDERVQGDPRHHRQRQDRHAGEQEKSAPKRDRPHRRRSAKGAAHQRRSPGPGEFAHDRDSDLVFADPIGRRPAGVCVQPRVRRRPASSRSTSPVVLVAFTPRNQAASATSSGAITASSAAMAR